MNEDIEKEKQTLLWGTYGKGGATHCNGTCPEHQLQWKRLIDCDTEHLQAILRSQAHIYSIEHAIYPVVICSILKDRGVEPVAFSVDAYNEHMRGVDEAWERRHAGTN